MWNIMYIKCIKMEVVEGKLQIQELKWQKETYIQELCYTLSLE